MTNADKFKSLFGLYATELWAMPEKDFLKWLNSEVDNCSESLNGSDTISRQAAIDALYHVDEYNGRSVEAIRNLTPVQPRKSGTWLIIGKTGLAACECGYITNRYYEYNFCPSCGTPMKK